MHKIFDFGEKIETYEFSVLNENSVRASAGIMFLFGIISLFSVFLLKTLFWAELFAITFIIEFTMRIFVNPKYAPYMIFGSIIVSNQSPNWVEAKPKKFAWSLGLLLGVVMAYFIVFDIMSPIRLLVCVLCLCLLYLESAFGICLGCLLYHRLNVKVNKCAGDICETKQSPSHKNNFIFLSLFILLFASIYYYLDTHKYHAKVEHKKAQNCQPPQWAIDMGHKEMWKKHHGCED